MESTSCTWYPGSTLKDIEPEITPVGSLQVFGHDSNKTSFQIYQTSVYDDEEILESTEYNEKSDPFPKCKEWYEAFVQTPKGVARLTFGCM